MELEIALLRTLLRPPKLSRRAGFSTIAPRAKRLVTSRPSNQPKDTNVPKSSSTDAISHALRDVSKEQNNLLSPVHIPEDSYGILNERHPAAKILANSAIVVQRQLEMMNVMLGFEQANKYLIMDPQGGHLGYMAEQESGMGNMMARQWFRTHRSFTTHVFDKEMKEILRFHRPFSYISSRIRVYDPLEVATSSHSSSTALQTTTAGALSTDPSQLMPKTSLLSLAEMRVIGEAQQQWAPLRRKYNLFLARPPEDEDSSSQSLLNDGQISIARQLQPDLETTQTPEGDYAYNQFAYVDEPFLSWDFTLLSSSNQRIGSVNRNFAGFGREIFTDTGVYALRMDSIGMSEEPKHIISKTGQQHESAYTGSNGGMSLDQRAVMLATAVSVDFDYFSRSRNGMGGMIPFWFMGGGEAVGGAAAGEAAGGVAAGEAGAGAIGGIARGAGVGGVGESAAVGAGTMAGYEAMQRGASGRSVDDASPTSSFGAGQAPPSSETPNSELGQAPEEVWGQEHEWNDRGGSGGSGENGGDASGGDGEGGGVADWIGEFFNS